MKKGRIIRDLVLSEISAVTFPAQEPALAAIIKSHGGKGGMTGDECAVFIEKLAKDAGIADIALAKALSESVAAVVAAGGSVLFEKVGKGEKQSMAARASVEMPASPSPDLQKAAQEFNSAVAEFNQAAKAAAGKAENERMDIEALKAQVAELTTKNAALAADLLKAQENAAAEIAKARKEAEVTKSDEVQTIMGVEIKKSVVGADVFEVMKKQEVERQRVESERVAESTMKSIPGTLAEKSAIVRAIGAIKDEAVRKSATDILAKANAAFDEILKSAGSPAGGYDEEDESMDAQKKFDEAVKAFAKERVIDNEHAAAAQFMKTAEGRRLAGAVSKANAALAKRAS